jgi:hypothetical protein
MSGRDGFRLSALLDTFTTKLLIAKNGMAITAKKLAQNPPRTAQNALLRQLK